MAFSLDCVCNMNAILSDVMFELKGECDASFWVDISVY